MQVFLFWAAALRKGEKEMKVVVKRVVIENEEFALIKDTCERGVYYGTIPYSELDENGKLQRRLNGYDMAIVFLDMCVIRNESPLCAAIKERERRIPLDRYIAEGHSEQEIIQFILAM